MQLTQIMIQTRPSVFKQNERERERENVSTYDYNWCGGVCTFLTTPWNVLRLICTFVGFNKMTQLPSSRYACSIPSKEIVQPR